MVFCHKGAAMDYFDWSPFNVLIVAQFCIGLAILVVLSLAHAPAKRLKLVSHENTRPKLLATRRARRVPEDAEQAEQLAA
jgi:hypothetical protein